MKSAVAILFLAIGPLLTIGPELPHVVETLALNTNKTATSNVPTSVKSLNHSIATNSTTPSKINRHQLDEPELKIIDVFICKLRKKLATAAGGKHYIETVWGRGYVLRDPAEGAITVAA